MTKPDFDSILGTTLGYEGGYNPKDPSNKGIHQKTYDAWRTSMKLPKQDVRNISNDELKTIYKREFFESPKYDKLPHGVAGLMFDFGVNAGPGNATKVLQKIVGAKTDGVLGPNTQFAVEKFIVDNGEEALKERLYNSRIKYAQLRVQQNPENEQYLKGWTNRINSIRQKYSSKNKGLV